MIENKNTDKSINSEEPPMYDKPIKIYKKRGRKVKYNPNDPVLKENIIELLKDHRKISDIASALNVSYYFILKIRKEYELEHKETIGWRVHELGK